MTCDSTFISLDSALYHDILPELLSVLSRYTFVDHVVIGGDLNTYVSRDTSQNPKALLDFI